MRFFLALSILKQEMVNLTGKFIVALVLVLTGFGVRAQCVFRFTGVVTDADNRQRLSGANVFIRETRKAVSTDENGRFEVEGLCAGSYNLPICAPLNIPSFVLNWL